MICSHLIKGLFIYTVLCFSAAAANGDQIASPISVKSLDAFHIEGKLEPPILKIKLTLQNKGDRGIRIRNGVFDVSINPDNTDLKSSDTAAADLIGTAAIHLKKKLYLGKTEVGCGTLAPSENIATHLQYIEIAANSSLSKIFEIRLSDQIEDRVRTLYLLINYLGFPDACKAISMVGNATVGRQGDGGWAYKGNMPVNIVYSP